MQLKKIEKSDLKSCSELYASVFSGEPWNEPWTSKLAYDRLLNFYNTPGFEGVFVSIEAKLVGLALGNIEPFHFGPMFNLHEVCVSENYQGKGAGTKMLSYLESMLNDKSTKCIYTDTDTRYAAAEFYLKNGFSKAHHMGVFSKAVRS